jgi:GNAT superfamily N-acetyltransferase
VLVHGLPREAGEGTHRGPEPRREGATRAGREHHAALVFDGDQCVGWCQFGTPEELPEVKSKRLYEKGLTDLPDWRITCFFTGKGHRGRGVADAALAGALAQIAEYGGGTVEGYPEETDDRKVSGSFLHTGPMPAFESHGFTRIRPISRTAGSSPARSPRTEPQPSQPGRTKPVW